MMQKLFSDHSQKNFLEFRKYRKKEQIDQYIAFAVNETITMHSSTEKNKSVQTKQNDDPINFLSRFDFT